MNKDNTKAPCSILEDKQLKLFDFFEEFSEYESYGEKLSNGCLNSDDNLIRLIKHGNFILNINMHFVLIVIPQMLLKMVIMFVNCIF